MNEIKTAARAFACLCCIMLMHISAHGENHTILKDGREWLIEYHMESEEFQRYDKYDLIRITGDTVVHGKSCRILEGLYGLKAILYEEGGQTRRLIDLQDFKSFEDNSLLVFCMDSVRSTYHDVDWIEMNGTKLERRINSSWYYFQTFYVEGIGTSNQNGIKHEPGPIPTGPYIKWFLREVRDNGEVVFNIDDFYSGLDKPYSEVRLVRTDRVWVYGGKNPDGSFYKSYCTFGPSVSHGIMSYNPFREIRRETYHNPSDLSDFTVTDEAILPDALIREQCGVVYMADPETDYGEFCIYMFNYADGKDYSYDEYWPHMTFSTDFSGFEEYAFEDNFIFTRGKMDIAGEIRHTYCYNLNGRDEPMAVEGIGITTMGTLPYNMHPDYLPEWGCPRLLEYRDTDGKLIHKFADFSDVVNSGVESIGSEACSDKNNPIYDLFGSRLNAIPEKGTVYICGGRKHVAR